MDLNDLLSKRGIDPQRVLVFRHRPPESELNRVLPWLAAEKPDFFNAYQQTQDSRLEKVMAAMVGNGYVASFIGHEPGKGLFVGLYFIAACQPLTFDQYWRVPAYVEMKKFGLQGWSNPGDERARKLWFELDLQDFYSAWQGKLVVGWPPPERSWWRRAHRNDIPIHAIQEDSGLVPEMPDWSTLVIDWHKLAVLPARWRSALSQWRGIYFIFDQSDGKGYVGSAYGENNILGRWLNYAARGHGGNVLLKQRDPRHFRFSILERVSPDADPQGVIGREASWKDRLHTRQPNGLNDN